MAWYTSGGCWNGGLGRRTGDLDYSTFQVQEKRPAHQVIEDQSQTDERGAADSPPAQARVTGGRRTRLRESRNSLPNEYEGVSPRARMKPPLATPEQLGLPLTWFAGNDERGNSRSLIYWDQVPWRVLSHKRGGDVPELIRLENVRISRDAEATVELRPAILADGKNKVRRVYPGAREEMVEMVLRRMAVQRLAHCSAEDAGEVTQGKLVSLCTTLYAVQQELEQRGHALSRPQIKEAMKVMHLCNVSVECSDAFFQAGSSGAILGAMTYAGPKAPEDDGRLRYSVVFHPLISAAILSEKYFPMNYERWMQLQRPLARWMANLLNVRYRYAEKDPSESCSFKLTLRRVLNDSGIKAEPRMRDNIDRVREAIDELRRVGYLTPMQRTQDTERATYARTPGRRAVEDMEWQLQASRTFASEIIAGNRFMRARA